MTHPRYRSNLADQPLDVTIKAVERLSDGFRPLDRITLSHAALNGGEGFTLQREVLRSGECAVIIPYDPATDSIVVIRQFRIGAALVTPNAAPLELPAGLIDPGESVAEGAARELEEETGLVPLAMVPCFSTLSSPGLADELAHFFLAIVNATNLQPGGGIADEHEDILPIAAPVEALIEAADAGDIQNGFLFCALQWFARKGRPLARVLATTNERNDTV